MRNFKKRLFIWELNCSNVFIIVIFAFIMLGCNRKNYVCTFPYDSNRLEYSILDPINHDNPNQFIISGKVLENKQPLIGVSINLPNTGLGTTTDFEGAFKLVLPLEKISSLNNHFVHFEYTGFQTLKVELRKLINQEILVEVTGY